MNPNFLRLVKKRNLYSFIMLALVMICYYGYILLIAFNREFLAQKLSAGMTTSIGVPLGVGVIPVSYTHLDVYKRQDQSNRFGCPAWPHGEFVADGSQHHIDRPELRNQCHIAEQVGIASMVEGRAILDTCLLYTSRCV